jgi:hypothetical protein
VGLMLGDLLKAKRAQTAPGQVRLSAVSNPPLDGAWRVRPEHAPAPTQPGAPWVMEATRKVPAMM